MKDANIPSEKGGGGGCWQTDGHRERYSERERERERARGAGRFPP